VTLAAPGDGIWTTQDNANKPFGSWRGTSFASPIVAGVAALVAAANPSLSATQIVSILERSADDLGPTGFDTSYGHGRINAFRAVKAASVEPGALPPWNPPAKDADTNAPSVTLTSAPANKARLNSAQAALSGTASDDKALDHVEIQVNDGLVQIASGTTSWSAVINLSAGGNVVRVRSVDAAGNVSAEAVRTFTYVVLTPLSAQANGYGIIRPNLDGEMLEIGKVYSMKAVPGRGQVFAGWSGVESESPVMSFSMKSNLALVANFVPTPFLPVKGSYAGLIAGTNGVLPGNSGSFVLTVTALGQFTGKLRLAGRSHGFRGRFNRAGETIVSVNRGRLSPVTLTMRVDMTNGTDQVSGSVTDGSWESEASGDRNVFNARLNPARQAGSHAFILQQVDDPSNTAAAGFSAIKQNGKTKVKGRLQDGRAFSASTVMAKDGDCPFFLSLSRGSEVVIGWLNFPVSSTPSASGTVLWVRTGTDAFAATLKAASPR
jgi:hypothetical protein